MKKIFDNKVLLIIISFIIFIVLFSIIYMLFIKTNTNNNPGGTGGDYKQPNSITITNMGVFYDSMGSNTTDKIISILEPSIIYNLSITNNLDITSNYIQFSDFKPENQKVFKENTPYRVTIDGNTVNSIYNTPWNYWFGLTVNDGRKFKLEVNIAPENEKEIYTVTKL